jgi:hypothetical protein
VGFSELWQGMAARCFGNEAAPFSEIRKTKAFSQKGPGAVVHAILF